MKLTPLKTALVAAFFAFTAMTAVSTAQVVGPADDQAVLTMYITAFDDVSQSAGKSWELQLPSYDGQVRIDICKDLSQDGTVANVEATEAFDNFVRKISQAPFGGVFSFGCDVPEMVLQRVVYTTTNHEFSTVP